MREFCIDTFDKLGNTRGNAAKQSMIAMLVMRTIRAHLYTFNTHKKTQARVKDLNVFSKIPESQNEIWLALPKKKPLCFVQCLNRIIVWYWYEVLRLYQLCLRLLSSLMLLCIKGKMLCTSVWPPWRPSEKVPRALISGVAGAVMWTNGQIIWSNGEISQE